MLLNNVSPQFNSNNNNNNSSRPQSPFIESQSQPFSQLKNRFQQPPVDSRRGSDLRSADFNQLPKRTVSLGPRRTAAMEPPNFPGSSHKKKLDHWAAPVNQEARQRRFSKAADELQASLSELNNLIEASPETAQQHYNSSRPPKFTSYITSTPEPERSFARHCTSFKPIAPDSPEPGPQPFTWQLDIDPQNWKASSSINDLRSMFEQQKPANNLSSSTMTLNRPPRSPNTSNLRNSPFHTGEILKQQQQPQANKPDSNKLVADYTIRRTISTSERTNVRNPYRSHYNNF